MSYASWFERHAKKHKKIVDKLLAKNFSQDEIIEYFDFDNMVKNEQNFVHFMQKIKSSII